MKRKGLCFIPLHDVGSNVLEGKITGRFADRIEFGLTLGLNGVQNVMGFKGSRGNLRWVGAYRFMTWPSMSS